jgi:hypothetical protein
MFFFQLKSLGDDLVNDAGSLVVLGFIICKKLVDTPNGVCR